jgi:hypothetical protein
VVREPIIPVPGGGHERTALAGSGPVMRPLLGKETRKGRLRQAAGARNRPDLMRALGLPAASLPWCKPERQAN